ncbi:MAG: methyltransferase domain-containing protein [Burkholderiaceae bacterium]
MKPRSNILDHVLTASSTEALMDAYGEWAEKYDHDLTQAWGYFAPQHAMRQVQRYAGDASMRILDAGCGTGLVGQLLYESDFKTLDGLDFSDGMLAQARKKQIYQNLY